MATNPKPARKLIKKQSKKMTKEMSKHELFPMKGKELKEHVKGHAEKTKSHIKGGGDVGNYSGAKARARKK